MNILAIDLGSKTGWAKGNVANTKSFGEWNLVHDAVFDGKSFGLFRKLLTEKMAGVDVLAVERPNSHMPGFHAYRVLFGMYGIVQEICGARGTEIYDFAATSIKKFWTGKGNAKKEDMVGKARGLAAYRSVDSHNVADAIAIYHYARSLHGG